MVKNLLSADPEGNVLVPCSGGYCEWRAGDVRDWREGNAFTVSKHSLALPSSEIPARVYRDRKSCLWWDGNESGLSYQCPGDSSPVKLPEAGFQGSAAPITELAGGEIAIPTMDRMVLGRPGKWRIFKPAMGFPISASLLAQGDGTNWISNGKGLFVFPTRTNFEFWTERDGLDGLVWAILPDGKSVFASAGSEIKALSADRARWQTLVRWSARSFLPGPPRSLLAGGFNRQGLAEIGMDGRIQLASAAGIAKLARTSDGQIWAGGTDGVSRVKLRDRRILVEPGDATQLTRGAVDLAIDSSGALWGCSPAGLFHESRGGWQVISKERGLLANGCISLAVGANGDVWYGYEEPTSAFSLIENPSGSAPVFHHYASGGEIGTAVNNFIHSDRRGWLWRGTDDGLYAATLDQAKAGQWLYLNRSDGLPSPDTNRRSIYEDKDGSLWFGMGTNVVHFSPPDDFLHPTYAPAVFVSGFSFDDRAFQMTESVDQIDNSKTVTTHIGSLQMDRRNAMRLRYRLLPDDNAWRLTRDLDIPLGKLPWGSHTLEVQARLFTGPWSQTVRQSFSVRKPVWLEWPALFIFVVVGGGSSFGAAAVYRRRKQQLSAELPVLAEWRMAALSGQSTDGQDSVLDDRFEVGRLVARGGFGTVFRGIDRQNQNGPCAIKIFRQEFRDKDWLERRFQHEIFALTRICHPNVVRIYGHGTAHNGAPYLAMEFIEGETLRELLKRSQLSRQRIASYLRQTGSALSKIHAHNVCHRDLKPENLMIRKHAAPGQEIVLIDFSIAIVKDPDETMHGLSRAAGTLLYMAPEQGSGYADASSDIYSLAKILLEMLTSKQVNALLPKASMDLPVHVREFFAQSSFGLSKDSVELIATALEFHPYSRAHDASSFADRIARDLEN